MKQYRDTSLPREWVLCHGTGGLSMKAMLLAVAVIVVVIGIFAYVVHTDPNRAQTRDVLVVLHENSSGVPRDPAALGYLELKNHEEKFDREYSVDHAMKEAPPGIVQGTLLKQDYLLRQAEYKLALIRSVGGDTTLKELEEKRSAYADSTKRFQNFWDMKFPTE